MFSLAHVEGITLGAGEEVDEVAGGAGGMGVFFTLFLNYQKFFASLIL